MKQLSILFTGDFAPCGRYEEIAINNRSAIFGDLKREIKGADLAFVNLESPLTYSNNGIKKSGPKLKASPKCVESLVDAGYDVIGLANNHIMDYGETGLSDTIEACVSRGLVTCGAGKSLKAAKTNTMIERKGIKISIIALAEHEFSIASTSSSGAAPVDVIANFEQISKAKTISDLVFVTIHGGNEYFSLPRPGLRRLCQFFIDIGVDGVICHHPHVPGANEMYKKKPIFYSLGNLIFDNKNPPKDWMYGYAVKLKYCCSQLSLEELELIPYKQSVDIGGVALLDGNSKKEFLGSIKKISNILENEKEYLSEWDGYCEKMSSEVILKSYSPMIFRGVGKISRLFSLHKLFFPGSRIQSRLNAIRCESHREVLLNVLEKRQGH